MIFLPAHVACLLMCESQVVDPVSSTRSIQAWFSWTAAGSSSSPRAALTPDWHWQVLPPFPSAQGPLFSLCYPSAILPPTPESLAQGCTVALLELSEALNALRWEGGYP